MLSIFRTPGFLKRLLPQLVWEIPAQEKNIYLTFDDGPTPEITTQVLACLLKFQAKATFFCLGSNVEKYPQLFESIKNEGHSIGNHGYYHLSGFTTSTHTYLENIKKGAEITGSNLFRPPYGRITPWQIYQLKKNCQIVMWTVMSMDFDPKIPANRCLDGLIKNISPGAIIVFHDTIKAKEKLLQLLPDFLTWMAENGYNTRKLL